MNATARAKLLVSVWKRTVPKIFSKGLKKVMCFRPQQPKKLRVGWSDNNLIFL